MLRICALLFHISFIKDSFEKYFIKIIRFLVLADSICRKMVTLFLRHFAFGFWLMKYNPFTTPIRHLKKRTNLYSQNTCMYLYGKNRMQKKAYIIP